MPQRTEAHIVRRAVQGDVDAIARIYNEGVADGMATLETHAKSFAEMLAWWDEHDERYAVVVAAAASEIVGWASLNRFSDRCAHAEIADLSVYVARAHRGRGVGAALLTNLEAQARIGGFRKIVLHALGENAHGKRLYASAGFTHVGVFREHGERGGRYLDVVAMEKLLR